jgi:hypothetical protein
VLGLATCPAAGAVTARAKRRDDIDAANFMLFSLAFEECDVLDVDCERLDRMRKEWAF